MIVGDMRQGRSNREDRLADRQTDRGTERQQSIKVDTEEIMQADMHAWQLSNQVKLNTHPPCSVIFVCFPERHT